MDLPAKDHQDDRVPSYEESLQQGATSGSSKNMGSKPQGSRSALLPQQISNVRSHNIDALIQMYIDPLIQSQVALGLLKSTFVLVPIDASSLRQTNAVSNVVSDVIEGFGDASSPDGLETVVGFPSATYVKFVRLYGAEFSSTFWRQEMVVQELESTLKARLRARGHQMAQDRSTSHQSPSSPDAAGLSKSRTRFSSWRAHGASKQQVLPTPIDSSPSSWRFEREEVLDPGHVRLRAGLREVCIRVKTEFGLYETRSGKAVVVNFEVGA